MSYAVWPATLPDRFLLDGLSFEEPDVTIRDEMDIGPAKVRARYTAAAEPFSGKLLMTGAQLDTFRLFYRSTLRRGALPFVWVSPVDGNQGVYRFLGGFQGVPLDGLWQISFRVEKLPV